MKPLVLLVLGIAATAAAAALWHGPSGAGARLASMIDRDTRVLLDNYEMNAIEVRMQSRPQARRILLSGDADEFQRAEMVRMMEARHGVAEARWNRPSNISYPLPLLAEAIGLGLAAFAAGLVIASVAASRARDRSW